MKALLICFSGIDGSGKTTLCKEVISELRSVEIPSRYVYGRFLPATVAPLFKLVSALMLHKKSSRESSCTQRESKKHLLRSPVVSKLFVAGILFDQILRVLLKVCLPSLFKREVIVCDRYLFDTVITDVALTCGLDDKEVKELLCWCLPIFPKADLVFVVHVPPRIAYHRKNDMHSIEVLEQLSRTYLYIGQKFGATIIDGTRDPLHLKHLVLAKLKSIGMR